MNMALVSLIIGVLLNFGSLLLTKSFLSDDQFNSFRVTLNTALNMMPLLCLGIDVALPVLNYRKKYSVVLCIARCYCLFSVAAMLVVSAYILDSGVVFPSFCALFMSLPFASLTLINNVQRSQKDIATYFLFTNLWDKVVRNLQNLTMSYLSKFTAFWILPYCVLSACFVLKRLSTKGFKQYSANHVKFRDIRETVFAGVPYLLPTIVAIIVTRYVYYLHYYLSSPRETVIADFSILFGLMYLVPSLNASKISEAFGEGSLSQYIESYQNNRIKIALQEFLVLLGIVFVAFLSIYLGFSDLATTREVSAAIVGGFMVYSVFPNMTFLVLMTKGVAWTLCFAIGAFLVLAISCSYSYLVLGMSVSSSFLISAFAYSLYSYGSSFFVGGKAPHLFRFKTCLLSFSLFVVATKVIPEVFE